MIASVQGSFPEVEIPADTEPIVREMMQRVQHYYRLFWNEFGSLSVTQLDWKRSPEIDSIGMIWGHILWWQHIIIEGDLLHKPVDSDAMAASRLDRLGRMRSGEPVEVYLAEMALQYRDLMAYLAGLRDQDLYQIIEISRPLANRTTTVLERLMMIMMHGFEHKGQMVLLTLTEGFSQD